MSTAKFAGSLASALAAIVLFAAPASAQMMDHRMHGRDHRPMARKVCKIEHHHGHRVTVCHMVRR